VKEDQQQQRSSNRRRCQYDEEFKRNAVELLESGERTAVQLGRELGVSDCSLGKWKRQYGRQGHREPIAPNRLHQLPLPPSAPNQVWCADITYLPSQEDGWLYLAAELDLCSKRLLGWKLSTSLATPLVEEAFQRALKLWSGAPQLHHSDRGIQYSSSTFRQLLLSYQVAPSMSRKACCYDNAAMESFWATLKTECFQGQIPRNLKHAQAMLFDYIETFYNPIRLHSSLGYLSPIEFENQLASLSINNQL
jgi:putative transposase